MLNELERLAAEQLAGRSPRRRADLQLQLDKWNDFAAGASQVDRHRAVDLRRSMEWALANGEVVDARRCVKALSQMLSRSYPPWGSKRPPDIDIAFPTTIEETVADFDAREYATMMRAFDG
jgi:hypothetical protein